MTRRDDIGRFRPSRLPPSTPGRRQKALRAFADALSTRGIDLGEVWLEVIDPDEPTERHSYRAKFKTPIVGSALLVAPGKAAIRALQAQGYQWRTAVMLDVGLVRYGETQTKLARAALGITVLVWLDERRGAEKGQIRPRGGQVIREELER